MCQDEVTADRRPPVAAAARKADMPINVTIPEVGESIKEGVLAEWSRADGDLVARDEPLLVLETDKITMNVNAAQAGRLKILVPAGTTVQIGQTVATIDTDVKVE